VQIDPHACVTDVAEFEAALHAADRTPEQPLRRERLLGAVSLYGGELLPGFYDSWIFPEQQRLASRLLRALRELVSLSRAAGDLERALEAALRALGTDALHEELHAEVMRLHLALGRPSAALRQYQILERALRFNDAMARWLQDRNYHVGVIEVDQRRDRLLRCADLATPRLLRPGSLLSRSGKASARGIPQSGAQYLGARCVHLRPREAADLAGNPPQHP